MKNDITPKEVKPSKRNAKESIETMMYVGPTIPGIVATNTVYNNGPSAALKTAINQMPAIKNLLVPISKLSRMQSGLKDKESAMSICYQKALKYKVEKE